MTIIRPHQNTKLTRPLRDPPILVNWVAKGKYLAEVKLIERRKGRKRVNYGRQRVLRTSLWQKSPAHLRVMKQSGAFRVLYSSCRKKR